MRKAFYLAGSGRKGPVLIDILKNVQTDECEYTPAKPEHYSPLPVPESKLAGAIEAINESKRPIIIAGGGIISANASGLLKKLAENQDCPWHTRLWARAAYPTPTGTAWE